MNELIKFLLNTGASVAGVGIILILVFIFRNSIAIYLSLTIEKAKALNNRDLETYKIQQDEKKQGRLRYSNKRFEQYCSCGQV